MLLVFFSVFSIPHSACIACTDSEKYHIEAVKIHAEAAKSHTGSAATHAQGLLVHMLEDAAAHAEVVTDCIEDVTVHIAAVQPT